MDSVRVRFRNKRNTLIVIAVIVGVGGLLIVCGNIGSILDYVCEQDNILAELEAGTNRAIIISAESCWDVGRAVYYEVREERKIVSSKHMLDVDLGEDHSYLLVYANNQTLVGVLETTNERAWLTIIYDFTSDEKWPRSSDYDIKALKEKWGSRIEQLQQENPDIEIDSFLESPEVSQP